MQRLRWGFMNWGQIVVVYFSAWMTVFCMSHFWLWKIIQWQCCRGKNTCWQDFAHYWLPTHPHLCRNSFTKMRENLHTVDISSSIYLSCLVNIVCECLLAQKIMDGQKCCLTLIGMRGDTFISLSFLDPILLADFLSKISKLFWRWKLTSIGLIWHPAKLIESYKKCSRWR